MRWLVTLAVFLVTNPANAGSLRIDLDGHRITTTRATLPTLHVRRSVKTPARVELVAGELVAFEREGALDVVDARTGKTVATAPLAGQGIELVTRAPSGDVYVKTGGDLVALARDGSVRWVRPSSAHGGVAVTPDAIVDGWVDHETHRFGIVSIDPRTGNEILRVDLGSTGGWYGYERVVVAPDGLDQVLVSTVFGVGEPPSH
jgi:hypothetical protein